MNKNTITLLLIFILPLITYFYVLKKDATNATESNSTKPKIIKFSSNLCSECQRMEEVVKKIYPKYQNKFELVSIPAQIQNDYNQEMISKYKITLVPTIILLNKNQQVAKRIEGYVDENTFENSLREIK